MPSSLLPSTLTKRLTLYYVVAFFFFLGASYIALYWSIGAVLDKKMDEDLNEDVAELRTVLASSGVDGVIQEMEKEVIAGENESVFLFLYRSDGELIHSTNLDHWAGLSPDGALVEKLFNHPRETSLVSFDFSSHESSTRAIYGSISPDYVLFIGESSEEKDDIMELLAIAFATVFLLTLPLASLLVWLLTRRSIAGIKSVSSAALDIKTGNLDRRVNAVGQADEVQMLADTFDAMADRIQKLIRDMREMTDNIAHDLRSPIARVRLLCESSLKSSASSAQVQQVAEDSIAECDRLIKMINTSLDVAETEAGVSDRGRSSIDMSVLVTDACELYEALAEEKGLTISSDLQASCCLSGEVTSLQRMVANLLDNAVTYTQFGGSVNVTLSTENHSMKLLISDTGVGLDESDYDNIFNRFYRVDPSRSSSGCGLGLSYARAVARAHHGDIAVTSKKGCSTTFTITLPSTTVPTQSSRLALA